MIEYEIIRSNRRTVAIEIGLDERVLVRAPKRYPKYRIQEFIDEKEEWILEHLDKIREKKVGIVPLTKGALSFNCLLMLMSDEIQDYVVVHELAHIRYMNHQKEFWGVVESVLPDYKERRKRLKEEGAVARQRFLAMK